MNALQTFLDRNSENISAFAVRIGRSPSTLTRALKGERNPSVSLALDVERGTAGAVSAQDFISICLSLRAAPDQIKESIACPLQNV